jgi:DNA-directed RNA polymerase specialized sigma24 family protein
MRNAVDKAILREREECARLCEDLFLSDGEWCAKSIRARDMSTKQENSDTSEECVQENDKSIHQPWDTTDMAHRSGGLTVDVTDLIERAKAEEREAVKRLWVGLTDEEIAQTVGSPIDEVYLSDFRRVIEKLKERNT